MTDPGKGTVLVTGGTGFFGAHLVPALRGVGWRVRLALRRPTEGGDEQVVVGPIGSATEWSQALRGVEAVVHLAARVHRSAAVQAQERDAYLNTNTAGTLRLAEAAASCGVRRLVFTSSVLVHGPVSDTPLREADPVRPASVYAETKARAEEALASVAGRTGLGLTIVRPPLVYGRGAKGNFALLERAISARVPLPFGAIRNRRAFVAAQNLAGFMLHALDMDAKGAEAFIVADDEQVSTPDFIRLMGRAMKKRAVLLPVPPALLGAALALAGRAQFRDSLLGSLRVDTEKARGTGWKPNVGLEQGLRLALGSAQESYAAAPR